MKHGRAVIFGLVAFAIILVVAYVPLGLIWALVSAVAGGIIIYGVAGANIYSAFVAHKQLELATRKEARDLKEVKDNRKRYLESVKPRLSAAASLLQPNEHNRRFSPPTNSITMLLEITNQGTGPAANVKATFTASNGESATVELGPIGPGQTLARTFGIRLGMSWNAEASTKGRTILVDYDGEGGWSGGRVALSMIQDHPPVWGFLQSETREATLPAEDA